ncbi:MAG: class I SAM-dependent methyltransferase [Nitrospiraceae bacterium]
METKVGSECTVCGEGLLTMLEKKKDIDGTVENILICNRCFVLANEAAFLHGLALQVHASETVYRLDDEAVMHLEEQVQGQQRLLTYVLPLLGKVEEKHMLEVGCGRGLMLIAASRLGFRRAMGVDPNVETFREVARHIQVDSNVTVHRELSEVSDKADCVVMWHALEHIPTPREFLTRLGDWLNDRAILFFQVPQYHHGYLCATHFYFYNEPSIRRLMASVGFEVLEIGYDVDNQFTTVVARYQSPPRATPLIGTGRVSNERESRFAPRSI